METTTLPGRIVSMIPLKDDGSDRYVLRRDYAVLLDDGSLWERRQSPIPNHGWCWACVEPPHVELPKPERPDPGSPGLRDLLAHSRKANELIKEAHGCLMGGDVARSDYLHSAAAMCCRQAAAGRERSRNEPNFHGGSQGPGDSEGSGERLES